MKTKKAKFLKIGDKIKTEQDGIKTINNIIKSDFVVRFYYEEGGYNHALSSEKIELH